MQYTVKQVTAEEMPLLYGLRARVLRSGGPPASAVFPGDDDPTTIHLGAFTEGGECIGVVTLMRNKGIQLRGMAVAPEAQGQGIGAALLREAERTVAERGFTSIWCNARVSAAAFYTRMGWKIESDEFEVPGVGPHYVMRYHIAADEE